MDDKGHHGADEEGGGEVDEGEGVHELVVEEAATKRKKGFHPWPVVEHQQQDEGHRGDVNGHLDGLFGDGWVHAQDVKKLLCGKGWRAYSSVSSAK